MEDAYGELGERKVEETGLASGYEASCQLLGMSNGAAAGDTHKHEAIPSGSGSESIPFGSKRAPCSFVNTKFTCGCPTASCEPGTVKYALWGAD
jgi:hypothetical protein